MLQRLMTLNDQIPVTPESITRFHSAAVPPIPILDYLRRIVRFTKVEKTCLLSVMHYIDQICVRLPAFTLRSLTVHRIVITAIALSSKALCDAFCTNTHYARVGGLPPLELARLEMDFLHAIDWRLVCTRDVLQVYYVNLVLHSDGRFFILAPDSGSSDGTASDTDMFSDSRSPSRSPRLTPSSHVLATSPSLLTGRLTDAEPQTARLPRVPTVEQEMAFEQFTRRNQQS